LLNSARMVGIMYSYDDEKRLPVLEDYTRMLLL
jgi:(3S)-linalool synthase